VSNSLQILAQNREALLLAETAAWLHDMGKCTDEMVASQARDGPQGHTYAYKAAKSGLMPHGVGVSILGESLLLKDLIEGGRPGIADKQGEPWILRALGRCHAAPHIEKEEPGGGKQTVADTRLSSPFGYEEEHLSDLTSRLEKLPFDRLAERRTFQQEVRAAFLGAPGDTRRPINEVTLWDWSGLVAALYKSALSGALLGHKPGRPNDLRWRLLAVRLDGAQTLERTAKLPALLARKRWLEEGFDNVRNLLEVEYPLGTEVYRDENGSLFVVPDIASLLDYVVPGGRTLRDVIRTELKFGGELMVTPSLDPRGWWAQAPRGSGLPDEIPPIVDHLEQVPLTPADPSSVVTWWASRSEGGADICTVSGVRPQGPSSQGRGRNVSDYWMERSVRRTREWAGCSDTTIWVDEVADVNGRLCLVVGQFGIDDWLKPDGFVGSLLVKTPATPGEGAVPKNPSFARLRRVWETTQAFWKGIETDLRATVGTVSPRLRVRGGFEPEPGSGDRLRALQSYEVKLANTSLSLICVGEGEFLTAENFRRLARVLRAPEQARGEQQEAAAFARERLLRDGPFQVEEPTGYGSPNQLRGKLHIHGVTEETTPYVPAVPILSEPRTFMAIVPADKALELVRAIRVTYQRGMGKVRNRLPLTVGLVFAGRRTPLSAVLDAGRRMLAQPMKSERWKVAGIDPAAPRSSWPDTVTLRLARGEQELRLTVATVMGDGKTEDVWYTYWCVENEKGGGKPFGRGLQFTGPGGKEWVHICELRIDDEVWLTPSRFDFQFLDTAARRFEIAYLDGRRRGPQAGSRPYYLEQLRDLESLASILTGGLSPSQIEQLEGLIKAKKTDWAGRYPEVFERTVRDAVSNANWKGGKRPADSEFEQVCRAAVTGQLADAVELFMDIPKPELRFGSAGLDRGGAEE
jgi:hypothetical protein